MKLFDLHCDTIGECYQKKTSLRRNDLNVSLKKAENIERYTQVFAIWIPDELRNSKATSYFNKVCDYFDVELSKNKDLITRFEKNKKDDKRINAILAVEGGAVLGGNIEELYNIYERGVRIMTLTWNGENEIASGAFCENGGLTDFGKKVLNHMEKLKMVVDVSHLNKKSFFDVSENTTKPFIASHSNPDIVNTVPGRKRNLTDEQIEIIKERNGLIGINFCNDFFELQNKFGSEAFKVHLDYLLSRGCENIIAIGSDFDGCTLSEGIDGIQSMETVYNDLLKAGFHENIVNNLFYKNAERFFNMI